MKVKATGLIAPISQSNGHAFKIFGYWYHQDDVEDVRFSVVVMMLSGEQQMISNLMPNFPLLDLRIAVAQAFNIYTHEVKLSNADDVFSDNDALANLGISDGSVLTLTVNNLDCWDHNHERCDAGNDIVDRSDGSRKLRKIGGADLTSSFGLVRVDSGFRQWDVKVCELGTGDDRSNIMIGVAHPDVPLGFIESVWSRRSEQDAYTRKLAYVKSPGNTSVHFPRTFTFGKGDVISVELDMDHGVASFKLNGEEMCEPCANLEGPMSLWTNLDYEGDCIEITD